MAQYTILNKSAIQLIFQEYGIENIYNYKVLSGGSENTNYLVNTEKGALVLTICERKTPEVARNLAKLLDHLAQHNFSTSIVIRSTKSENITCWDGKPIMIKKYLPGDIIEDLPEHLLKNIGQELSKLHQISAPDYLPKKVSYGMEYFEGIKEYAPNSPFQKWLTDVKKIVEKHTSNLPKTLIHSDVFYNNVIISKDGQKATIMDFEEACFYYRVFDIGMIIVGLCAEKETINLKKAKWILEGYQIHHKLLENELLALKPFTIYAAAAIAFWRHRHYHFIAPDPTMEKHYLIMKKTADYMKNLPDNCFD